MSCFVTSYEIPSKFALIKYVLECASDVGCCMKPAKMIGDSQVRSKRAQTKIARDEDPSGRASKLCLNRGK